MKVLILTLALLTIATSPALAAFPQPSGKGLSDLNETLAGGPKDAILFIDTMANWLFAILLTIAVIYILLAAYEYMSSKGGEGVEKAHKMLLYAAVGIAIAVLAKGIVFAVRKLVDNSTPAASQTLISDPSSHA